MKVIIRVYDGQLSSGAKEILIEALEIDDLLLTGEFDMPASTPGHLPQVDPFHELTFEEEAEEEDTDTPKEEPA